MEGRRINRRERKYNPLFVLFLCLIAAVIVLLIVALALGIKLGKANKSLKAAESQVRELQQSVSQLEDDLETARSHASADPEPTPTPEPVQEQTPTPQPVQEQTPAPQPESAPQTSNSGSWLNLSGHSEVSYKPTTLLDGYKTYYTSDGVNLRSGPGTGYSRIQTVNRGTAVQVAAREGNWSFVKVGSKFGWISSDYLGTKLPEPQPSAATRSEATSGSLKKN